MKKRKILSLIILLILIGIIIVIWITNGEKPIEKTENNFEIINENYRVEDNVIYYEANLINNAQRPQQIKTIEIIFLDENDKEIVRIINDINKALKSKETIAISSETKVTLDNKQIKNIKHQIN